MSMLAGAVVAASGADRVLPLHYRPEGRSAVCVNGTTKFNRALYGAHSGFRMECSDMPEFGIYLPKMGGNLRFELPKGECKARYTAGRMDYEQGGVTIEAQVDRTTDGAYWRLTNHGRRTATVGVRFGGVAEKRFSREGDLGVDPADCFELKPEYCKGNIFNVEGDRVSVEYGAKERKRMTLSIPFAKHTVSDKPVLTGEIVIPAGESRCVALIPADTAAISQKELQKVFGRLEKERRGLASTFNFTTPDEWLNPVGGALSLAADGIWSGEAWLHGSIGWRTPHLGWRGAYVGDALGWYDRAVTHLRTYAANQVTDIPAVRQHPCQDSTLNLARAVKKWGTPMYSNGYICRRPGKKNEMSHYDMNMVYADAMLRHFRHTGNREEMRELFPVIKRHLAWEKLNFDPDGDCLYDAYCCIWASDALYYNGGSVTHSSAYNLFANTLAAQVAEAIGEDATPYRKEAQGIREAMEKTLWMNDRGHWAEFKDRGEDGRLHPAAALWTIYHAIDSEVASPFKNYTATVYVDQEIPHIPVTAAGMEPLYTLSTTNWKPYSWSINNVAIAEVMHTALAFWQAGRADEAYKLMRGVMIDNMYTGASPLNFGQISQFDAARNECYRDFADPIGVWSRALTEGLFGIRPDLIGADRKVKLIPGFPSDWDKAEVTLPNFSYKFQRKGNQISYKIANRYGNGSKVELTVAAEGVKSVSVNGRNAQWKAAENAIGAPRITIDCGDAAKLDVKIVTNPAAVTMAGNRYIAEGPVRFRQMFTDNLEWWKPEVTTTEKNVGYIPQFKNIKTAQCEPLDISGVYNSNVADIFKQKYLSPRPNVTTLQIPVQGIGEWCHPDLTAEISDAPLREILKRGGGVMQTELGVPLRMPAEGMNVAFTSLWDNFPNSVTCGLKGSASHLYLLLAGTTNHMQWGMENGAVTVVYTDGTETRTPLINPLNWQTIELDEQTDEYAFANPGNTPRTWRLHFATGNTTQEPIYRKKANGGAEFYTQPFIPMGAGVMLDIPLDASKTLKSMTLETLSRDVVIGLMGATLQR